MAAGPEKPRNAASGVFVTGTDTGCGKTEITLGLMSALQSRGLRILGMKPVATGCEQDAEGLRNADAEQIRAQGSCDAPYGVVNPFAFSPPIAPHIAAGEAGVAISTTTMVTAFQSLRGEAEFVVVEGVGGWRVPLGPELWLGDIPKALDLPVILVVGLKLGCLNHAILTVESIQSAGVKLAGWIANQVEPAMLERDANLATLGALIQAPCIGTIPWLDRPAPAEIAAHLRLAQLDLEFPAPGAGSSAG
ncbi:dethiobiotin synthase [Thiorhodococcus mannitoliphagus]|uniref:ATP-dependent dethiobiotin synthetase BioD n=1 Tax=Thiorhodococcus mannitoliphagus TaxID=329406 RepID=A0A6P1DZS9_9GAMM|nr:dethiobiotin synthase [Thiorhodococcus mannitoliphagus]NEX23000.1 dethiobiotin synthase [Thiorhodococcus mannitoliphagus]